MTVAEAVTVSLGTIGLLSTGVRAFANWVRKPLATRQDLHEAVDKEFHENVRVKLEDMSDDIKYLVRKEKSR